MNTTLKALGGNKLRMGALLGIAAAGLIAWGAQARLAGQVEPEPGIVVRGAHEEALENGLEGHAGEDHDDQNELDRNTADGEEKVDQSTGRGEHHQRHERDRDPVEGAGRPEHGPVHPAQQGIGSLSLAAGLRRHATGGTQGGPTQKPAAGEKQYQGSKPRSRNQDHGRHFSSPSLIVSILSSMLSGGKTFQRNESSFQVDVRGPPVRALPPLGRFPWKKPHPAPLLLGHGTDSEPDLYEKEEDA